MSFMSKLNKVIGTNIMLGELLCCSCRCHGSVYITRRTGEVPATHVFYEKWLAYDEAHTVKIWEDGRLELESELFSSSMLQDIVQKIESMGADALQPFGDGVCLAYAGKRMECAMCGSEEFCTPAELLG